jgi:cytochrome c oxidase subunit 3
VAIQPPGDPHDMESSHHAHHPRLQHHFDDMAQQAEASTLGMWVFLVTEIMFFGGLFMAYLLYRYQSPEGFAEASNHLNVYWGAANTVVLIVSSLTMALAVRAAQVSAPPKTQVGWLVATMILGAAFLGVKVIEYADKFEHHLVPGPNFQWPGQYANAAEQFYYLLFWMSVV